MIELQTLKFKGIGRFVEPQEIHLTDKKNIIGINAENRNTGGSSGGAKSTIFKAIDWLYGVNDVPTTVLKSRYAKDMEVIGFHLWNGKPLTISRSTKTGLSVEWVDDSGVTQSVSGNSSLAEEKLSEILKIPRELFRLISHKRQDEGGFFLNLTPKDSFEFLMSALNLSEWQKKLDALSLKVSDEKTKLETKRVTTTFRQEAVESAFVNVEAKKTALENAKHNLISNSDADVLPLEALLKEKESQSQDLRAVYQKNIAAIVRPNRSDYTYTPDTLKVQAIASLEAQISDKMAENDKKNEERTSKLVKIKDGENIIKAKMLEVSQAKKKVVEIEKDILLTEQKISKIESGTCHTCNQHWANDTSATELSNLKEKHKKLLIEKSDQLAIANTPGLDEKIAKLQDLAKQFNAPFTVDIAAEKLEKKNLEDEIASERKAIDESYMAALHMQIAQSDSIEKEYSTKDLALKNEIKQIRESISAIQSRASFLQTGVAVAEKELKTANDTFDKASQQLSIAKQEELDTQKQHDLAEEGRRAIKSYLMTVFEEALDEIGERASRILSQIPNMNTATIYFEPFKEVTSGPNKGKVKEEVTAILSVDGEAAVPIKSISGGERASVDLAVDLAVVDLVEEKGGIGTNYLILDEPCTGLDSVCKEQYIEVLKNSGTKKKILIVDHSSEIKEMVDDTILVIREGLYSRIEDQ